MLIVMTPEAADGDVAMVEEAVRAMGLMPHRIPGEYRTAVAVIGKVEPVPKERFEGLAGVAEVIIVSRPYKRVSRATKRADTVIDVRGRIIGGSRFVFLPGLGHREDATRAPGKGVRSGSPSVLRHGLSKPNSWPRR